MNRLQFCHFCNRHVFYNAFTNSLLLLFLLLIHLFSWYYIILGRVYRNGEIGLLTSYYNCLTSMSTIKHVIVFLRCLVLLFRCFFERYSLLWRNGYVQTSIRIFFILCNPKWKCLRISMNYKWSYIAFVLRRLIV